jgi:phosphoribosylformylglycinamidine synthase subunit PurS
VNFPIVVDVTLRAGIADPEGATIERALPALGFTGIAHVRTGKTFRFDVEAPDEESAIAAAHSLSERLLSNPVIERAVARLEA